MLLKKPLRNACHGCLLKGRKDAASCSGEIRSVGGLTISQSTARLSSTVSTILRFSSQMLRV